MNEYNYILALDHIGAYAVKLNTSAQSCSQEVVANFEPTIFLLLGAFGLNNKPWVVQ